MDIFRVLSRGASLKKSKDIVTDYALPSVSGKPLILHLKFMY